MLFRLLAAFILIPLIELYLLLRLASVTSVPITIGVVVVTGVVGTFLARREGVMAWIRFRTALAERRVPSREIQDGLMIVFAAALLLTPGLLTDAVGFVLLIPQGRTWIRRLLLPRIIGGSAIHVTRFRSFDVHGTGTRVHEEVRDAADEDPQARYSRHGNGPDSRHGNGPDSRHGNGPDSRHGNGPDPRHGNGPVTLEGHAVHKSEPRHST